MSSTINASTSGIVETADSSGVLELQTAGTTAVYIDNSQNVTIPKNLTINGTLTYTGGGGSGVTTFSAGTTGLTPSTPTAGVVTLGGTLGFSYGGTGLTSAGSAGNVLQSNGSTWASNSLATAGIAALGGASFTGALTNSAAITSTIGGGYASLQSNAIALGTVSNTISSTGSGNIINFNVNGTLAASLSAAQFVPSLSNTKILGSPGLYWSEIWVTTGAFNTSDGTQKQQIAELTTAELAVARTLKGLIRTYKLNSAVQTKGENARIHTGVIAQDVAAAFAAQGLDVNKYGLYGSDTWYEVNGSPIDANGKYYTAEDAGAVATTQLAIRYDELLAFIIAGI